MATRNDFYEEVSNLGPTASAVAPIISQPVAPLMQGMTNLTPSNNNINNSGNNNNNISGSNGNSTTNDRQHSIRFSLPTSVASSTATTTATVYPIQHHPPPSHQQQKFEPNLNLKQNITGNLLESSGLYQQHNGETGQYLPYSSCMSFNNSNNIAEDTSNPLLSGCHQQQQQQALNSNVYSQQSHLQSLVNYSNNNTNSNNCNTTNNNLNCVLSDSGLDSLSSDVLSQSLGSSNGLLSPQLNQLVGHSLQSDLSDYNNGGGKTYPCSSPSNSSSSPFYYQQQQQQPTQLFSTPNTNQQKVQNLSNSINHNNNYQPNILNSNNSNSVMCSNNGFSANYNNSAGNKLGYNTSNMNNMTSSEMESPVHQRSYIDLTNSTSKQPTANNSYYYPHQQQLPLANHSQKVSKRTSYEEPEIVSNAGGSYNYPAVQSFPYHHPVAQPGRGPIYNAPNQQMIPSNLEQQKLYPRRGYHQTMYPGDAPKAKPTYGHIPYQFPEHVAQKRVPANYNYLAQPNQSVPPVNPSLRNYSEVHHTGEYDLSKKQLHPSHMGYPPTNPVPSKYPSNSNYFPAQYEDYRQSSKSIAKPQYPPGAQMLPASNAHRGGFNVHANGYYPNLPMNYSHPQVNSFNNSATTYPAGPYPTVPHPYQPSEMAYNHYPQSHPNYPKLPSHQQKPIEEPYPVAKYNRPCYYETTTADKIPYIDLEEQINSSKIPKTRSSSYPQGNIDYHHAQQYPHQFYPQMATSGSGVNNMKYSSMYGKERYRYPPVAQHYPPGLSQGPMHHHHMPPMAAGHFNPNHHFHPHLMQHPQFDDGTKKINVREFLSSWNDDEEEAGGAFDPNQMTDYQRYSNYAKSQQIAEKEVIDLGKTQRIQVGISIDKTDLISSSALNLPDIVVDIEKQQQQQQQQQQKTGSSPVPVNDQNSTAEEKLYVIESIDVPISELNKYKHLSVINKLPENIIHIVNKPPPVSSDEVIILDDCENNFNESELIEKADEQPGPTSAANEEKVSSGVENSMKFIEEIESNSDFKNDFELNVEYDAFAVKKQPETPVKTTDRKESVIVANNIEVKSVKKKHKRKRVKKTSDNSDLSDSEQVSKKKFKSLVKCCLDVINTKGYRRNANIYLSSPESEVIIPEPIELKYFRRKCFPVYNPESLRNLCENVLSEMSLIPEVPVAENVEVESEVMEVPKLRDLCEEVLKLNHYIIDMDELCEIGDNEVGQDKADNDSTDNNNNSDNNNHNNGNFCLINLLSDSTDQCAVDFLKAVEDGAEFQVISDDDDDDIQERTAILEDDCLPCDNTNSVDNDDCVILDQPTQRDELMDCDYFLEEMNSIQCEEEIIPIDLDRHRRDVLTESLRLKYVNKSSEFRFALSLLRRYQRMTLINRQTRTRLPKSAKLQNRYKVIAYFQRKYGKKVKTIVQQQISEIVDKNNCPKPASNPIVPDTSPADKLTTEPTIINLITPLDNQHSRELTENVTRKAISEDKSAHKSSYREAIPNQFKDNGRKSVEKRHRLSSTTGLDQETLNGSDNGKRYRRHKSLESRKKWVNRSNSDDTSEKTKSSDSFENDIKSARSGSSKVIKKKTISSKKIKPNFDEMLLNIDSIYKSVSKPKPLKRQKDHLDEIRSSIESSSSSSPLSTTSSSSSSQQSQPENGKRKRKLKFSDYKAMLNTKPKQPPKIRNLDLDKIITKQAVVQLERDGYIDKLGKLYT